MSSATLYDAKARLSALISDMERSGEPVVITRHGKPVARLVPIMQPASPEDALAQMRLRARESGVAYQTARFTDPLPPDALGPFADA